MSACPDKAAMLHAYLDGELDAINTQTFEAHLKTCADCAEEVGELHALRDRFAAPELREPAPAPLRGRIEAMIEAETARPRARAAAILPWGLSGAFGAIAASLAVMTVLPSAGALEAQLVADHVRSTFGTHLVDVETSDRHTVKPWFNGRIDFAPPVVDLADAGYPLVGGRLDYADHRLVAALVYRRNKHVINVFVWPQDRTPRRPALAGAHEGYAVTHWTGHGLQFWAVSDVDRGDLEAFSRLFAERTGA